MTTMRARRTKRARCAASRVRRRPCGSRARGRDPAGATATARASTTRSMSRPIRSSSSTLCAVRDARDVLLDDRAGVELLGDVVRGRADDLDAALARAAVRVGADERRQERVVDVDHRHAEPVEEVAREDLHVAREHDEVDSPASCSRICASASALRLGLDRNVVVRDAEAGDVGRVIRMVRDDADDVGRRARRGASARAGRAGSDRRVTRGARCACGDLHRRSASPSRAARRRARRKRRSSSSLRSSSRSRAELHAHEERAALGVGRVLVGVEDVRVVLREESRDRGDDAVAVGARRRAAARCVELPPRLAAST